MALAADTPFGPYVILSPLGSGGMGEVYRARDTRLGRDVALKILPQTFAHDPDRIARFQREAQLLASLNHPNIGAIYGVEEAGAVTALVLELVEGITLAETIVAGSGATGGLPVHESLIVARQIADALDAAHERGIVHRDLKPANVKITPEGVVKVLDFGLAKAGPTSAALLADSPTTVGPTIEGMLLGTAPYMSPEQSRGKLVDKRTDLWAFGCLLFEVLTGTRAFGGETSSDAIAAILQRDPAWALLPSDVPPNIQRLIRRCLEKDPKRRLRDIGDARIEIEDALSGAASPVSMAAPHPAASRPAWLAIALAVAVPVALGIGWLLGKSAPAGVSPPKLSRPVRLTNGPAQEFGPAIAPDGKWVAYYANERGRTDVWIRFLDSGATLNLTASLNLALPGRANLGGLAISPDAANIAFLARQASGPSYDTWIMPAPVGGVPHKMFQVFQGVQWSPDGKRLACIRPQATGGDTLVIADGDGGNQRELVPGAGGRHLHWPAWSRDGKYIYFIHTFDSWQAEPTQIYRVAAAGGSIEPVVDTVRRAMYPVPLPDGGLLYSANPDVLDLGLWWRPPGGGREVALTTGFGEFMESQLSSDGRRLVSTLVERRQSLDTIPIAGGAAEMQPLNAGNLGDTDPAVDLRTGRLAFSSRRGGERNLWIAKSDGTGAQPLTTTGQAIDERPAFSPDGQQIAFVSDRGGRRGIWLIGVEGGAPRFLGEATVLDTMSWSRDGKRILFARPEGRETHLASVTTADGRIVPFPSTGRASSPAWSPTKDVIAYLEPTAIVSQGPSTPPVARMWLRFIDGEGRRMYTDLPDQSFLNGRLAWSPDGRRLAALDIPANGASKIWIVDPGAKAPFTQLAELPSTLLARGLVWSRDGSALIVGAQETVSDIVMFDIVR